MYVSLLNWSKVARTHLVCRNIQISSILPQGGLLNHFRNHFFQRTKSD